MCGVYCVSCVVCYDVATWRVWVWCVVCEVLYAVVCGLWYTEICIVPWAVSAMWWFVCAVLRDM